MKKMRHQGKERKGMEILLHATGWIILFILPQFLLAGDFLSDIRTSLIIFFKTLVFGIVFYVNYLWLIPVLLHRKRGLFFWPSALILVVVMHIGSNMAFLKLFPPPEGVEQRIHREVERARTDKRGLPSPVRMVVYNYFITAFLVTGFAIALRASQQTVKKEREIKELEKEKLNSELALLKNQVSPHFFFNTLNNIYSLIEINQKDAQDAVLSLSKMMRYLLYDSEKGNTKLSHEIDFMKGYIDLMRLRMSSRVSLSVDFPAQYEDTEVPPLLFISFIENAFKHGVSYQGNSFIEIVLKSGNSRLTFTTRNSVSKAGNDAPQPDSGIGLENVKKRLGLLYPGKHKLVIMEKDQVYSVELTIDTSKG